MPKIVCLPDKTQFPISGGREEKLAAIGETVNVARRIESASKESIQSFYGQARGTSSSATPAPTCICRSSKHGTRSRTRLT